MNLLALHVSENELRSVLFSAMGGSRYWARFRDYDPEAATVELRERDQDDAERPGWHRIGTDDIARAIVIAAERNRRAFATWATDRIGDASTADVFLQIAVFGRVIYG